MDKLYTKRIVPNEPQVDILDTDGDHITSVPPEAADALLSHLNNPGRSYQVARAEGTAVGDGRAVVFYEVFEDEDRATALFRSDNFMETLAVHSHLNRGA